MLLSNLLHYDSEDDDDTRHVLDSAASSITAAPTAVHPVSHSTQPSAPIKQLEKRALSDDGTEEASDSTRKRKRVDTVSGTTGKLPSSSPSSYVPPPASFFSFATAPSESAPAAPTDLLSILPPPKNTRTRHTVTKQSPATSTNSKDNEPSAASSIIAASPPPRPPSPPPIATATSSPSIPSSSSAQSRVAPSPSPLSLPLPPPPGIRKRAATPSQSDSTDGTPPPPPFAPPAFTLLSPAPRIAYSTASPYAVQSSSYPPAATTAIAPAMFASSEEPRMQRQWLEAAHIVDVRVDELTQPPSASSIAAAAHQLQSANAAVGDVRLKTTYWDARQGKEVSVVGVAGKQQRAHQINSLAIQAKKWELDILRVKENGAQVRRDGRSKYGW